MARMKKKPIFKIILAALAMSLLMALQCFADEIQSFPFNFNIDMNSFDKLCYAGHIKGGGIFYDDGYMVLPEAQFSVSSKSGVDSIVGEMLSLEIDLIYENQDNTGCVKEVLKKYDFGDLSSGKQYPLFSETVLKNLKQRKKLYSNDIMTVKVSMNYRADGGTQKKQILLFYVAKNDEYQEKTVKLAAPPEQ